MAKAKTVRAHVWISGRVQGVFFRGSTEETASGLGLTGWVRNLPDGRVEAVFEGPEAEVEKAVAWCRRGPGPARVEHVELQSESPIGEFEGFRIVH